MDAVFFFAAVQKEGPQVLMSWSKRNRRRKTLLFQRLGP